MRASRRIGETLVFNSLRWAPSAMASSIAAVYINKLKQSEHSVGILTQTLDKALDGGCNRPSARDRRKRQ